MLQSISLEVSTPDKFDCVKSGKATCLDGRLSLLLPKISGDLQNIQSYDFCLPVIQ